MKKVIIISLSALFLNSCAEIQQIGALQVAGTKAIKSVETETLGVPTYKDKEIRQKASKSIDQAIDLELTKYPGATHMVNVKIYMVTGYWKVKYAVIGEIVKSK